MNILKILAQTSRGANFKTLKQIYTFLILSKLEFGSFLFFNSKPSSLKMIDIVHNLGLRLAFGVFRSNSIPSLLNISYTLPLSLIKKKKTSCFYLQNEPKIHHGIRTVLQDLNFKYSGIINHECPITPPSLDYGH